MNIRLAKKEETEAVKAFYYTLIDEMEYAEYSSRWKKDVYPDDGYLRGAVERGEMFVAEENGCIIASMVVNHSTNEGYEGVSWTVDALPGEVTVIHTLAVAVDHAGKGIGRTMVEYALRLARQNGQKAVRLDVILGNLPAEKLYKSCGFRYIDRVRLYYEDTGWTEFDLYEYVIGEKKR